MSPSEVLKSATQAVKSEDFNRAYMLVKKLNKNSITRSFQSMTLEAFIHDKRKKYVKAVAVLTEAIKLPIDSVSKVNVLNQLGRLKFKNRDYQQALTFLVQSVELINTVDNAEGIFWLARVKGKLGHYDDLDNLLKPLRGLEKYYIPVTQANLDMAFHFSNKEAALKCIYDLRGHWNSLSDDVLSNMLFRMSTLLPEAMMDTIKSLRSHKKIPAILEVMEAFLLAKSKSFEKALEKLTDDLILNQLPSWFTKAFCYEIKARSLDNLGRYDEAFHYYQLMNEDAQKRSSPGLAKLDPYEMLVKHTACQPGEVDEVLPFNFAFLVGFPRSGTTLLENILNSQNGIITLDEKPVLENVIKHFKALDKSYPKDVEVLTKSEIQILRHVYLADAGQYISISAHTRLVVDKMPPSMLHIPLINKLFPEAKIIMALRHPMDNCLSCFFQNFRANPQMRHFTDWQRSFERYKELFVLFEEYEKTMTIPVHYLRYEDLVDNLENVAEKLFSFLAFEANKSEYLNFAEKAKDRIINTPSRDQVRAGLYTKSKYRWKNYQRFIEPHKHNVEYFIKKFGYEA